MHDGSCEQEAADGCFFFYTAPLASACANLMLLFRERCRVFLRVARTTLGLALVLFSLSCGNRPTLPHVEGKVLDIFGEALPGVVVSAESGRIQTLTDHHGQYRIYVTQGETDLDFMKNGYTRAQYRVESISPTNNTVVLPDIVLHPLPSTRGVYLLEGRRFFPTEVVEPAAFLTQDGRRLLGVRGSPERGTDNTRPTLLAYEMPMYDVQLYQLGRVRGAEPGSQTAFTEWVWIPVQEVPIHLEAVDAPKRSLFRIIYETDALPQGVYAIHWGALHGRSVIDPPQVFIFRIGPPLPPPVEEEKPAAEKKGKRKEKVEDAPTPPAVHDPESSDIREE
jgi:hypothetical protein